MKYTKFGAPGFIETAHGFDRNIIRVLCLIYTSTEPLVPTYGRVFKDMLFGIEYFKDKHPEYKFIDVCNQGFERNMVIIGKLIEKY